jgi:hypothetical protein
VPLNGRAPCSAPATAYRAILPSPTAQALFPAVIVLHGCDVIILTRVMVDDLAKQNKLAPGNIVYVASTPVALAARAGAPKPDISTADASIAVGLDLLCGALFCRDAVGRATAPTIERKDHSHIGFGQ